MNEERGGYTASRKSKVKRQKAKVELASVSTESSVA